MTVGSDQTITPTSPVSGEQPYLLVVDDDGSRRAPMPSGGTVVIGRSDTCDVQIGDPIASRNHARIDIDELGMRIIDMNSHNGTRVNGHPLAAARQLTSGDVIGIGSATLIVHLPDRPGHGDALDDSDVVRRLRQETARALRHGRPLAVVLVDLGGADGDQVAALARESLEPEQAVAPLGDGTLLFVLPETTPAQAVELAGNLPAGALISAPGARAAAASFPRDGADAGALVAAARAALAGDTETLVVGDRTVIVADPAMIQTYQLLRRLAPSELSVLITGETGVGKEMAASALHAWSPRASGPFIAVDCAALPDTLVESELFGHEKGAFSGAERAKPGRLELAVGGTLFLDEVGELPPAVQAKLLRTLEQRSLMRVGSVTPIALDFRLVAATNRDVAGDLAAGTFREDLYYRIAAASVELPPLRDRPRDVPILARSFLARACRRLEREPAVLSDAALRKLAAYRFPGNVRELANAMEFAATTAASVIEPWHLPTTIASGTGLCPAPIADKFRTIADEIAELECRRMSEALEATGGNQSRAAELIGMPRRSFVAKMRRYGLTR